MMKNLEETELCFPQLPNSSCRKQTRPHIETVFVYALLSSIALLTATLNLLVIISISHFKYPHIASVLEYCTGIVASSGQIITCVMFLFQSRQLHTPTNLLLCSLAVSDFLVGFLMSFQILFLDGCWILSDQMCAMYGALDFVVTSAPIGTMVLISVDRYIAICDPLHYHNKITIKRVKVCVCLCWVCSVIYNTFILKDNLHQPGRYNSCYGECVIVVDNLAEILDLVFTFVGPVTVIIILYTRVFVVAVSQARAMRSHITTVTIQRSETVVTKKSEMKAARTLGVVVVVFLMCLFPYFCSSLVGFNPVFFGATVSIETWIFYFNSCLNPLIYAFCYPWFQKSIKLIVTLKIFQSDSCEARIL